LQTETNFLKCKIRLLDNINWNSQFVQTYRRTRFC